jgi:hypothetical protein
MANLTRTTRDHDEIRRWAEERGGKPSHVKSTGSADDPGILRIDFPGYSGEGSLESIDWDQWFEKFDEQNLALLYEEQTAGGERSNFNKIVKAATASQAEKKSAKRSAPAAKKSAGKKTAAKKAPAKKAAAKKAAVKKSSPPKKSAPAKKASKGVSKKSAAKKKSAVSKKAASKKSPAKKRR